MGVTLRRRTVIFEHEVPTECDLDTPFMVRIIFTASSPRHSDEDLRDFVSPDVLILYNDKPYAGPFEKEDWRRIVRMIEEAMVQDAIAMETPFVFA